MDYIELINRSICSTPDMAVDLVDLWVSQNFTILELLFGEPEILSFNKDKSIATLTLNGILGVNITEQQIENALDQIKEEKDCKGILLKVNSPGGASSESYATDDLLTEFKKETKMPIVSFIDSTGASAGYMLAARADKVIASRGSRVGSIGSMAIIKNESEANAKNGIKYEIFKSGKYKNFPNSKEPLDDEGKEKIQAQVDKTAKEFFNRVAEVRNISADEIKSWEGAVFSATEAKSKKIIDEIGSEKKALSELKNLILQNSQEISANTQSLVLDSSKLNNSDSLNEEEMNVELQNQINALKAQLDSVKNTELEKYKVEYQKAFNKAPSQEKLDVLKGLDVKLIQAEIADLEEMNKRKFAPAKSQDGLAKAGMPLNSKDEEFEEEDVQNLAVAMLNKVVSKSKIVKRNPNFNFEAAQRSLLVDLKGGIE